jgi:hypothetical protein
MDARPKGETGMKKLWLTLGALLALSIGIALAEGKDGKANDSCKPDSTACCCCAKSCPK